MMCSVVSFQSNCTGSSPDYAKVIKVSSTALSAKWLLEGENHTGYIIPVPYGCKDTISKPERKIFLVSLGNSQHHLEGITVYLAF